MQTPKPCPDSPDSTLCLSCNGNPVYADFLCEHCYQFYLDNPPNPFNFTAPNQPGTPNQPRGPRL